MVSAGMLIGLIVRGRPVRAHATVGKELDEEDEERLRAALRRLDESEGPDW
jgi:hypothetical protein